jgi:anti-anti-sigma factor
MMTAHVEIKVENNLLLLRGDLDFNNAKLVNQQVLQYISKAATDTQIDFAGLTSTNSVVIALMVDWMRAARTAHKKINFTQVSADVTLLAEAAGLEKIIA